MEWKKAVAQASAIYASKHKGKSPVGKKHAVKKKAAKKRAVGKVDKKLKKGLASKGLKMPHGYDVVKRKRKISGVKRKPSEKAVLKSIKKAVNVQKAHMSGIGALSSHVIHEVKEAHDKLIKWQKVLLALEKEKTMVSKGMKPVVNMDIKRAKEAIKEQKTHIAQLKKHIK
jgi:hypothetical protein